MTPCLQALVRSGVVNQTVGIAEVEAQFGEWTRELSFHVINGKVQLILGYPRLKDLGMTVDCTEDCLHNKSGKKILCHAVRVKGTDKSMASGSSYVKVTQTRDAKGSKVTRKGNRLLIPVGVPVVLGPKEHGMVIFAFRVQETGIQAVVNVCQMPSILVRVSLRQSRDLGIQIFNSNEESKIISEKVAMAGVMVYPDSTVEWDKTNVEELSMEVNRIGMEEWECKFFGLFEGKVKYGDSNFLKSLTVCHKDIDWKVSPKSIPKANTRVTYNVGEVTEKEALDFVRKLEAEGIISEL